jgi:hypothetical protein
MATTPGGSFRTYVRIDAIDNSRETKRVGPATEHLCQDHHEISYE